MNNIERRTFLEAAIFPLIGLAQSPARARNHTLDCAAVGHKRFFPAR